MARKSILVLLCLVSFGLGDTKRLTAQKERLYEVKLEKRCAYLVQAPLDLDVRSFNLEDGSQSLVFYSGQHDQIVIVTFTNGEVIPDVTQYVIELEGPRPPPEPDPDPDPPGPEGFAKQVKEYVSKLALDADWKQAAAQTMDTVASEIGAGALTTKQAANSRIYVLNGIQPIAAKPFWNFLEKYLTDQKIETPTQMRETFEQVAEGLR